MSCARKNRHRPRGPAGTVLGKPHFRLTLSFLVIAGLTPAVPVDAQPVTGSSPGGGVPAGTGPDVLPPVSSGPFGLPNPLAPPNALPNGITPAEPAQPASSLALPEPGAGITTLQQYDPNAPAVLIQPYLSVGERFTDNVNFTHSDRIAAAETSLIPAVSISADTPRLRGVLSAQAYGNVYVPSAGLDQVVGNLFGGGTATIVPDRLFVDANSVITQGSTLPGLGFVNPNLLPQNQQTQVFATSVSPYLRESFDGMVDTELRYRFGATNFGGNTAATPSTLTPAATNLSNGILNEGSFIAATGQNFERALSRLTVVGQTSTVTRPAATHSSARTTIFNIGLPQISRRWHGSVTRTSNIRLPRWRHSLARPGSLAASSDSAPITGMSVWNTDGSRAFTALPDPPIIR